MTVPAPFNTPVVPVVIDSQTLAARLVLKMEWRIDLAPSGKATLPAV